MKPVALPYPDTLETIGDHIRKKRLDLRLRQKDIAELLGVEVQTVTNWEKHHSSPMLHLVPRVAAFLGYDPFGDPGEDAPLGERIVRARRARGIRQEDLAQLLGVDPGTLAKWERGERRPGPLHLNELRYLFEYSAPEGAAKKDNGGGRGADSDR